MWALEDVRRTMLPVVVLLVFLLLIFREWCKLHVVLWVPLLGRTVLYRVRPPVQKEKDPHKIVRYICGLSSRVVKTTPRAKSNNKIFTRNIIGSVTKR